MSKTERKTRNSDFSRRKIFLGHHLEVGLVLKSYLKIKLQKRNKEPTSCFECTSSYAEWFLNIKAFNVAIDKKLWWP